MARFEFTMVSDAMLQGLAEADATGAEILAYIMLIRGLPKDRSNAECWMPADMAEAKGVMSAHTFSKMLRSLASKPFTTIDGEPRTILTKVTRGCRGHCPHYEDTLGRLIAEGAYPPPNARQSGHAIGESNGDQTGHPKEARNGDPKQAPIDEFSTLNWGPKTNQLGTQNEPIGDPTGHPIETRQDKQLVADALLPTAERSVGVSQPDKQNPKTLQVDTETVPARAEAGAGQGRPAPALPSWAELIGGAPAPDEPLPDRAEYDRVARMLEDGRYGELTEHDREVYHAGHKAYASNGYEPEP